MSSVQTTAPAVNAPQSVRHAKGCKCKAKAKAKVRNRAKLLRWAVVMEALDEFENILYAAEDDGTIDDSCIEDIHDSLRSLRGELFDGMPQQW